MSTFIEFLRDSPLLTLFVAFVCAHPLGSGVLASASALAYVPRKGHHVRPDEVATAPARHPIVSVVIPAHNEQGVIERALSRVLQLDWPALDVIVVDDGSTDATVEVVMPYVRDGRTRLLRKPSNEGKSMAINDALETCVSDVVLVMDADGAPDPAALQVMVPHLLRPGVAAVTGNPRVLNTRTNLARLQAIEFSATVGVHRRADAVWGRLTTFSGLCTLVDRRVIVGLGGFAPEMATEDIEMTWRLQLAGWRAEYEPSALFGMQVPERLSTLWTQRRRWVIGLAQVIRRHGGTAAKASNWRMWPVLVMSALSIFWAHAVVLLFLVHLILELAGVARLTLAPLLLLVGAVTLVAGIIQALIGMSLDRRNDPDIYRQIPWIAWYPLCYWVLNVVLVARYTLTGLLRKPTLSTWNLPREAPRTPATPPG